MHVIDFNPDGSVQAMCREDVLPLNSLGAQTITRASDIRYQDGEGWAIWLANSMSAGAFVPPVSEAARGFATYDHARQIEVLWLENCRLHSTTPTTGLGLQILSYVRREAALGESLSATLW